MTWHGKRDVRVEDVADPSIKEDTDAIVRVRSSGICGSDLHLYEVMASYMTEGDILGTRADGRGRGRGLGVDGFATHRVPQP